jgi:hypothetical protein
MSNKEDYQAKLGEIKAIANDKVQLPVMPTETYLQEAENLYHWSLEDAPELATVGITQEMLDELPVRAGALREAQSLWFKDRYSPEEAEEEWKVKSPEAFEFRDDLLHSFRFAFRKDEIISARVAAIAEGSSNADMIQDLNDLSVLGKAQPDALKAIGFKMAMLDEAAAKADEMADLLAIANGDRKEQSEAKSIRDKAYTYLKELVDEIRDAGKYLFWRTPERYKGYVSQYWKRRNSKKTESLPEEE